MKALLIEPDTRRIETVDLDSHADIARLVGYDTLESDAVGTTGNGAMLRDVAADIEDVRSRIQYL